MRDIVKNRPILKWKIIIIIIIILCSYAIYVNVIYYLVPYNPINKYYNITPYNVHFSLYLNINNNAEHISTYKYKTEYNNKVIFDYFKNLNLIPLSQKEYYKYTSTIENDDMFVYTFYFKDEKYGTLFLSDIFIENPSVLRFSSYNPYFPEGHYKIIDGELDYNYINTLITDGKDKGLSLNN